MAEKRERERKNHRERDKCGKKIEKTFSREKSWKKRTKENEVYRKSWADKVNGRIFVKQNFCNDCIWQIDSGRLQQKWDRCCVFFPFFSSFKQTSHTHCTFIFHIRFHCSIWLTYGVSAGCTCNSHTYTHTHWIHIDLSLTFDIYSRSIWIKCVLFRKFSFYFVLNILFHLEIRMPVEMYNIKLSQMGRVQCFCRKKSPFRFGCSIESRFLSHYERKDFFYSQKTATTIPKLLFRFFVICDWNFMWLEWFLCWTELI